MPHAHRQVTFRAAAAKSFAPPCARGASTNRTPPTALPPPPNPNSCVDARCAAPPQARTLTAHVRSDPTGRQPSFASARSHCSADAGTIAAAAAAPEVSAARSPAECASPCTTATTDDTPGAARRERAKVTAAGAPCTTARELWGPQNDEVCALGAVAKRSRRDTDWGSPEGVYDDDERSARLGTGREGPCGVPGTLGQRVLGDAAHQAIEAARGQHPRATLRAWCVPQPSRRVAISVEECDGARRPVGDQRPELVGPLVYTHAQYARSLAPSLPARLRRASQCVSDDVKRAGDL